MTELVYKDEVFAIIGAAMEVHTVLGHGFLEAVYQEALGIELLERGIPFETNRKLTITYKGTQLKKEYCADVVCFDKIIIELKAEKNLNMRDEAQILNYLKASGLRVGLLINFGARGKLEWKKLVMH